ILGLLVATELRRRNMAPAVVSHLVAGGNDALADGGIGADHDTGHEPGGADGMSLQKSKDAIGPDRTEFAPRDRRRRYETAGREARHSVEVEREAYEMPRHRLSPELRWRRPHDASFIPDAGLPVAREQERPIEIDEARSRRDHHRRRHRQRAGEHATDHYSEAAALRLIHQRERLGQSAGLVQLDVDVVVPPCEPLEADTIVA